jgi:hypothetical protein
VKKNRIPKVGVTARTDKQPKALEATSYHGLHPSWRLGRIQMQHPYGCQELKPEEWERLRGSLGEFEKRTWEDILVKSKKQNHNVEIETLSKKAQNRLKELFKPLDFDQLLSLRLSGTERIWGVLDRGVVTLLWWDPNHEVRPSELKNT